MEELDDIQALDDQWPGTAHDDTDRTVPAEAQYTAGDDWPGQEWPGTEVKAESADQWPGQEWPGTEVKSGVEPEGKLATAGREAAHSVVPGLAGLAGMGAGMAAGAGFGLPGIIGGGLIGALGAGVGTNIAQKAALKHVVGFDDSKQREVNKEENPWSSIAGGIAGGMVGLSPSAAASPLGPITNQLVQRGFGAGFGGVMEAGHQLYDGEFDGRSLVANIAAGAAMPGVNRVGQKFVNAGGRMGPPGRPDMQSRPGAEADKSDADISQTPSVAGGSAHAQGPAPDTKAPVGQSNSKAAGPEDYRKTPPKTIEEAFGEPPSSGLSVGSAHTDPTLRAALPTATLAPEAADVGRVVDTGIVEAGAAQQPAPQAPPVDPRIEQAKIFNAEVAKEFAGKRIPAEIKARFDANVRLIRGQAPEPKPQATLAPEAPAEAPAPIPASTPTRARVSPERWGKIQGDSIAGFDAIQGRVRLTDGTEVPVANGGGTIWGPNRTEISPHAVREFSEDGKTWYPVKKPEAPAPVAQGRKAELAAKHGENSYLAKTEPEAPAPIVSDRRAAQELAGNYTGKPIPPVPPEVTQKLRALKAGFAAEETYTPEQQAARLAAIEARGRKSQAVLGPEEPPAAAAKPVVETPVIDDTALIAKMRKQGMNKLADTFEAMPPKTRDLTRSQIIANMPRDRTAEKAGLKNKLGAEANNRDTLAKQNRAIDAIQKAHDNHPPGIDETPDQLVARLAAAVDTAHKAHGGNPLSKKGGYRPLKMPDTFRWFNHLQNVATKRREYWTPDKVAAFHAEEARLRSGTGGEYPTLDPKTLDNSIEANRRTGDALVTAKLDSEAVNPEDKLIAAIDAKRGSKSAEEALSKIETEENETDATPRATLVKNRAHLREIEAKPPADPVALAKVLEAGEKAKKLKDQIAARAEEAMKKKGTKRSGISLTPEEVAKLGGKGIVKGTEIDPAEKARIAAVMALAETKGKSRSAPSKSFIVGEKYNDVVQDLTGAFIKLGKDEGGKLDLKKVMDDLKDWGREFHASASKITLKDLTDPHYVSNPQAKTLKSQEARNAASIADKLQGGVQQDKIDKTQALKFASGPEVKPFKDKITQKELYLAHEKGDFSGIKEKGGALPGPMDFYNKYGKPIMEENAKLKALIDSIAPDKLGRTVLNHIYRMAEGANFREDTGQAYDPVTGTHNPLSTRERGTALERTFVALDRPDGKRFIVSLAPEGADYSGVVWDGYKGTKFKDPNFEFEDGKSYQIGKNKYKMGDALTEEIEANALNDKGEPMKYKKNFIESALVANTYLRSLARHLQLLEDIKNSPEFQAYSTKDRDYAHEHGWTESKTTLPGFEGYYMEPRIREVLDDFQQPGFNEESLTKLRNLSRAVTKTIFWLPTAHAFNVGAHWYVGRGWDWITPQGYKSLALDGMEAIRSVISQDDLQRRLARNEFGGVYAGILGQNYEAKLARALGAEIERQPHKWGPVAHTLDMTVGDLVRNIYDASSRSMWAANDVFLTQAILENLRKVGVNGKTATDQQIQQAIKQAERHIPNYRMPSRLIFAGDKGRTLSKALGDPLLFAFGRYHVGVYNSFAHMTKDIVHGTGAERFQSIGHLMAMMSLVWMVKPIVDYAWKSLTGNEDAEARGRGPLGPIENVGKIKETGDVLGLVRSTVTLSPLAAVTADLLTDFTGFGDKAILNKGDVKKAAHLDPEGVYNVAKQATGYLAGNLIAPIGTLNSALGSDHGVGGTLRDQILDIKNPSDRAVAFKNKIDRLNQKTTVQRERRPPTITEKLLP